MPETSADPEKVKTMLPTFYCIIRPLIIFCKVMGTFPLKNVFTFDGRNLRHKWLDLIVLWDIATFSANIYLMLLNSRRLIDVADEQGETFLANWLTVTWYLAIFRGLFQFIVVHITARRLPLLFTLLEEYHQIIGASIFKASLSKRRACIASVLGGIGLLCILEMASLGFFKTMGNAEVATWPLSVSFTLSNLWRELPMCVFIVCCIYITSRFYEIREEIKRVREEKAKDTAARLQTIRLMHVALMKIVAHLESCYGFQIAVNSVFLIIDMVIDLYVFFANTNGLNYYILFLVIYFFMSTLAVYAIAEQMQRTHTKIAEEVSNFHVSSNCEDEKIQVQLFTSQLAANPLIVTASGFFPVNNSMVATVVGAVGTYCLVLVQVAPMLGAGSHSNGRIDRNDSSSLLPNDTEPF